MGERIIHSRKVIKDELALALACIGDGVVYTDDKGIIKYVNSSVEDITGWTCEQIYGREFMEVFPIYEEESKTPVHSLITCMQEKGSTVTLKNHSILKRKDGIST